MLSEENGTGCPLYKILVCVAANASTQHTARGPRPTPYAKEYAPSRPSSKLRKERIPHLLISSVKAHEIIDLCAFVLIFVFWCLNNLEELQITTTDPQLSSTNENMVIETQQFLKCGDCQKEFTKPMYYK
jgi:hypothetical protein